MKELKNKDLVIFGGKGGTGKTTCSTASGIHLADQENMTVLTASVDPAGSLGDSLEFDVGNTPKSVPGVEGLFAVELDAEALIENYREEFRGYISQLLERGTYLDSSDISHLLDLPLPGIDEVTAVLKLNDFYRQDRYDAIILDTPPAGHMVNLLNLPGQMLDWLDVLNLIAEKHRYVRSTLVGDYPEDEIESFLRSQKKQLEFTENLLTDGALTGFVPVLESGNLNYRETRQLFQDTDLGDITSSVVYNRAEKSSACRVCSNRHERGKKYLEKLREDFPGFEFVPVNNYPGDVSGVTQLKKVADHLFGDTPDHYFSPDTGTMATLENRSLPRREDDSNFKLDPEGKYLLFGGKGGVGKTTAAVSAGLHLADRVGEDVLVISVDPSGSLDYIFSEEVEARPTPVEVSGSGELHLVESDQEKGLEELKERYRRRIEGSFSSGAGSDGVRVKYDRKILSGIFDLIPPGVSEITALADLIDHLDTEIYDRIILDTAPTGHLVRLLELPEIASGWLSTALNITLKYREVIGSKGLTDEVAATSRKVRRVKEVLFSGDEGPAELIGVTVPEKMAVSETRRLIRDADSFGINRIKILVNKVIRGDLCGKCLEERRNQDARIEDLFELGPEGNTAIAPLLTEEPDNRAELLELSDHFME